MPKKTRKLLSIYGRLGGKIGGKASLKTMTPEQRSERARQAGLAASANMTPEQRSERARNAALARSKKPSQ